MQGFKEKISTKLPTGGGSAWGGITGTLSSQTDLQTALDGKVDENAAITGATKTKITYDAKGLVTAGADATTADIADSTNKRYVTDAQQTVIGNTSGTNTGDQTSIVGISGTIAQFNTACSDADFATGGGTASGTNTGDQTSIVGITGTKAQFDTAVSDGNIMYVGDAPTAHTHPQSDVTNLTTDLSAKQATLVSGTNIKTINGSSVLGSGDLTVSAGALSYSPGSFTIATETGKLQIKTLKLTTTQRLTIEGTGRLNIN